MRKSVVFGLAAFLVMWISQASADLMTYSSESEFLAATGASLMESFETVEPIPAPGSPIVTTYFTVTPDSPVPSDFYLTNLVNTPSGGSHPTDGDWWIHVGTPYNVGGTIILDFSHPINHFGFSVVDFGDGEAGSLLIRNDVGDTYTIKTVPPLLADANEFFFGLVNTSQTFTHVEIEATTVSDGMGFDEFYFTNSVPEPSSLALSGVGVFSLFSLFYRRRK